MKKIKILNKVYKQKLDVDEAYRRLFHQAVANKQKSRFIKINIKIKDHPFVSGFIKLFTLIPLPTGLIRFFIRRSNFNNPNFSTRDLLDIISMKHVSLHVLTEEAKIKIKTI